MCLLALLYRVVPSVPVIVGANREEAYSRGGDPPRRLSPLAAAGGVDPGHGGTWLGVNSSGLLVAVTNRPKQHPPTNPCSRGLLVRDLLASPSAKDASLVAIRRLETESFAGCNLLCVDAASALVIHAGDWLRVRPLPPGVHVLSNRDVNDPTDVRVVAASLRLQRTPIQTQTQAVAALQALCGSKEPVGAPMCFRDVLRGTVSSSIVVLSEEPSDRLYLHAQGPPDITPYTDVTQLLRELS